MLCGYTHGLYDTHLHGWRKLSFVIPKFIGGASSRTETVWLNYDESGQRIRQNLAVIAAFERLNGDGLRVMPGLAFGH